MNKFFSILLIFIGCNLYSQSIGTQFTPDRSYYKSKYTIQTGMFSYIYGYPNHFVKGDTVISGNYYQKVFYNDRSTFDTVCFTSSSLMFYNNKKLYIGTTLIYDFNLVVGDTFRVAYGNTMNHPSGIYTYTVTTSDSVFIGTKWRKRLTLSKPPISGLLQIKWVDGIGDINYGFNANYTTAELAFGTGKTYTLSCFSENFQYTYGSGCGVSSICGIVNQTSKQACDVVSSNINFNIYAGTPPYSFFFQPPIGCSSTYSATSTNSITTFSLTCGGVYTINIKDSNNSNLGTITHTVNLDSLINIGVNSVKDTVCENESTQLSIIDSSPTFTINPINWSNGGFGSSTTVTPTVTTTYSVSGIYTTANTRTCTAKGTKIIQVNSCVGIEEVNKLIYISIFPNPSNEKITIINNSGYIIQDIQFLTIEGKNTNLKPNSKNEINTSELPEGVYFLKIQTELGYLNRKLIIQRD